jgi:hypothetical protein
MRILTVSFCCHLVMLALSLHPAIIWASNQKKVTLKKSRTVETSKQKEKNKEPIQVFSPPTPASAPAFSDKIPIPIFLASSSPIPSQKLVEFYKAVRVSLTDSEGWESVNIEKTQQHQAEESGVNFYGNLPVIDRTDFRKKIQRRRSQPVNENAATQDVISRQRVRAIQQYLDQLRVPGGLVVDCSHGKSMLLKGCGIYYYDRVKQKVSASVVKLFSAGTHDASAWATPLVKNLENGLAHAQRSKDEKIIEELMSKEDLDDQTDTRGHLSAFASTSSVRVSGNQASLRQNLVGFGVEAGMMLENVGAYFFASRAMWNGSSGKEALFYKKAQSTDIGLGMNLRAKALDQLLWGLQIAVARQTLEFELMDSLGSQSDHSQKFKSTGLNMSISPSMGILVSDLVEITLGPVWGWYSESDRELSNELEQEESPKVGKSSTFGLRFRVGLSI